METLSFEAIKGHMIVPIGDRYGLIDTGSPSSISSLPFELFGHRHSPPSNMMGITMEKISELSGIQIDILIGCNILSQQDIRIRWSEQRLDWGNNLPDYPLTMELKTLKGLPIFPLTIGSIVTKAIFDTGAHLSYIDPTLVVGKATWGKRNDFSPFVGTFTVSTYMMPTALDKSPINIEYGIFPESLQAILGSAFTESKASAVIGTQLLDYFDCMISWSQRTISWKRR